MNHSRREEIHAKMDSLEMLPSLPRVVSELLRLLGERDYSMHQLMEQVRQDPALTARVLKVANSARFGRTREIESLNQALVILGEGEIQCLVTTISVMRAFDFGQQGGHVQQDHFWAHSVGCAEMTQQIAASFGLRFHGTDFIAGLLHDVGKVVLDQHFHEEFMACIELTKTMGLPLFEAERRLLGVDHAEVGAWLAMRWDLPGSLVEAIRCHHDSDVDSVNRQLVACVRLANHLVKGESMSVLGEGVPWSIELDPSWEILACVQGAELVKARTDALARIRKGLQRARDRVAVLVHNSN
jgi:putative nucleotidyltransferase with HDIG domain